MQAVSEKQFAIANLLLDVGCNPHTRKRLGQYLVCLAHKGGLKSLTQRIEAQVANSQENDSGGGT